jgi:hypothetical protein
MAQTWKGTSDLSIDDYTAFINGLGSTRHLEWVREKETYGWVAVVTTLEDKPSDSGSKPMSSKPKNQTASTNSNANKQKGDKKFNSPCDKCGAKHGTIPCRYDAPEHNINREVGVSWTESEVGKQYAALGFRSYPNCNLDEAKTKAENKQPFGVFQATQRKGGIDNRKRAASGQNRPKFKKQSKLCDELLSLSESNDDIMIDCFIFSRTFHIRAKVLIDSGAKSSNYISSEIASRLNLEGLAIHQCNVNVCSAFDICRKCLGSMKFNVKITSQYSSFEISDLSATIIESPYDLIVGLPTIRKYDLTMKFRHLFVDAAERTLKDGIKPIENLYSLVEEKDPLKFRSDTTFNGETIYKHYKEFLGKLKPEFLGRLISKEEIFGPQQVEQFDEVLLGRDDDLVASFARTAKEVELAAGMDQLPIIEGNSPLEQKVKSLLIEYKDIFARVVGETPAKIKPMQFEIDEEKWSQLRRGGPARRHSPVKNTEILRQLNQMLELKVIQPSQSPYYSQVLLAPKPGGKWRFCIDYRTLNQCMISMGWPLPHIGNMIQRIGATKPRIFGIIDTTSGYHQVLLDKACRQLAAFVTEFGVYEPTRVAFGLKTAPSYFQKEIAGTIMSGLNYHILEMYIDDILLYSHDDDAYLENLGKVFKRCSEYNITLNPDKCRLCLRQVEFVGHLITDKGYHWSPKKLQKVFDFETPQSTKQLKSFLGLANYFHEHVESYSLLARPLLETLQQAEKSRRLYWTADAQKAFETIKGMINNNQSLFFCDENNGRVIVETDASDYAIGGVCYQETELKTPSGELKTIRRPLRFFSQALNSVQRRWATIEKEAFAIVRGLKSFDYLIRDVHFILRTDHKNLKYMNNENAKIVRWKLSIQEFNFDLEYYEGELNVAADAFSRLLQRDWEKFEDLCILQELDIPDEYCQVISRHHNDAMGHHGIERTMNLLRKDPDYEKGEWLYAREYVRRFIAQCPTCQKLSYIKPMIQAKRFTLSSYSPLERIQMDTIGPLPKSTDGHEYILVIIDCFTKFSELYALKTVTADEAAVCLLDYCGRYGPPSQIISDNGTQFVNEVIKTMMKGMDVPFYNILAGSKEENGIVERANGEVLKHLKAFVLHYKLATIWKKCLPLVQRIMNFIPHTSTGVAPAQLLFGVNHRMERGLFSKGEFNPRDSSSPKRLANWMDEVIKEQQTLIDVAVETLKERDDRHLRSQPSDVTVFSENSYVLVAYTRGAMGRRPPTKLHSYWRGPLRVVSYNGNEYTLQNLVTGKLELQHVTALKQYNYDPKRTSEQEIVEVARTDTGDFVVQRILAYAGDLNEKKTLDFLVKWEGLSDEYNLWLPWKELKDNEKLHQFCENHSDEAVKKLIKRSRKFEETVKDISNKLNTRADKRVRYNGKLE